MKGGQRPGAGRKPRPDDKMIRVSVSLTPEQYDWLKAQDASMGETVRKLIEDAMSEEQLKKRVGDIKTSIVTWGMTANEARYANELMRQKDRMSEAAKITGQDTGVVWQAFLEYRQTVPISANDLSERLHAWVFAYMVFPPIFQAVIDRIRVAASS